MIYLKLFLTFLKIGAFTFGGGYAMLPLIQQEVAANGWMTQDDIVDFIAISESTPGPFAVNVSTYIGMETGGIFGAVCATFGVVLPSFVIILLVAKAYERFKNSKTVIGCMTGLKPAVIGLIGSAVLSAAVSAFAVTKELVIDIKFAAGVVFLVFLIFLLVKKINPIIIIFVSAVFGIIVNGLL